MKKLTVLGAVGVLGGLFALPAFADQGGRHIQMHDRWSNGTAHHHDAVSGGPSTRPVPEPATLSLLALGIAGAGWSRRRNKR